MLVFITAVFRHDLAQMGSLYRQYVKALYLQNTHTLESLSGRICHTKLHYSTQGTNVHNLPMLVYSQAK